MHDLQLRKVISPSFELQFWVFLDSMESPLSQEYIDMPDEDSRCHTAVLDGARHSVQLASSGQLVMVDYA